MKVVTIVSASLQRLVEIRQRKPDMSRISAGQYDILYNGRITTRDVFYLPKRTENTTQTEKYHCILISFNIKR